MFNKKKNAVTLAIIGLVIAGVNTVNIPPKNLKVLPPDISDQKLDSIMQSYNIALGVKCNFCHAKEKLLTAPWLPVKDSSGNLDYASDAEPMKENARKMMRMTIAINQTNFYFDINEKPEYLHTVTCKTCHRGEELPPEY